MNTHTDIVELLSQAIEHNRIAQNEIYKIYGSQWYSICLRYQKSKDNAMDVLQESLIKIYSKLKSFDSKKGNFSGWSNTVVINENLMSIRKAKKEIQLLSLEYSPSEFYAEKEIAFDLSAKELLKLVQELPMGYSTIFNLYVIEGYTHVEISEIMDISVGTSKSQLHKAKLMMRKKIKAITNYPVALKEAIR